MISATPADGGAEAPDHSRSALGSQMDGRDAAVHRGYVRVPWGELHYARCGEGDPVVLIHQTPRSSDEFRDVLPLMGAHFDVIAPDTAGFGASDLPGGAVETIELYADGVELLLDGLGLDRVALVGHHTGGLVALEVAARPSQRARALVLSSTPCKTPHERATQLGEPGIDEVEQREDGSHLTELWRRRQAYYPKGRPDLLERLIIDALRAGDRIEEGHRAVNRYCLEERLALVAVPVLVLVGSEDPFAFPMLARWRDVLPTAAIAEVTGGMVPMPDQLPAEFAAVLADFLTSL